MMKSRVRYLLIMLIFVVSAVVYIDRSNISIAGTYLAADYHISKIQLGWVFSAFLLGYAAFQIPAGWVVGKLGPRKTLTYGLIWWSVLSVATALVPPTMTNALWVLIAVRFILGLGEAVAYPSSNQFIAAWFPTQERGKANGWVFGGVGFGSGTAPPLVAFIVYTYGWHAVFYVSAVIGLAMAAVWYKVARDTPAEHPTVTAAEKAHILAGMPVKVEGPMPPVPWLKIFTSIDVWGTTLAYVAFGYVAFIFHTWFFIYLKDGRGLDLKSSALLGMLPFIAMTTCCLLGGVISDWLVKHQGPICRPQPVRRLHAVPVRHLPDHRQPCPGHHRGGAGAGGRRGRALSGPGDLLGGGGGFRRALHRRDLRPGQYGRPDRGRGHGLADALFRLALWLGNRLLYRGGCLLRLHLPLVLREPGPQAAH